MVTGRETEGKTNNKTNKEAERKKSGPAGVVERGWKEYHFS